MNIEQLNKLIQDEKELENISTKEISDTHHTFEDLYKHRAILFCTLCNMLPEHSWKSRQHFDNDSDPMYDGSFICGINTPEGLATYHIKEEYWDLFEIPELPKAPKYDNYSQDEVFSRLLSISETKNNQR